jgi:aryl-alcohol dehydrogenase-like predicted oxidoreductase
VSRLGIGASYGVPAHAIEKAYREHGVNFFYWGSIRRPGMREAIRNLSRTDRDRIVVALQSYDRAGIAIRFFHERGLRALGIDAADLLILGWHNRELNRRLLDAALDLRERGLVRFLAMSGHDRALFGRMAERDDPSIDVYMVRYNAAHRGAERDVFPFLPANRQPGVMAYTATRWGRLLDPKRVPRGERPLTSAECYRFALTNPAVDLCMVGPASEQEMIEGLLALEQGPMSEEDLARARRIGDFVHSPRFRR